MAEDILFDIDYDSIKANEHSLIIREAFRLKQRIELIGMKVSKVDYKYGQYNETNPKINCRNRKQNFITICPKKPTNPQEGKILVMVLMALGKVCNLPALSVDVLFKGSKNEAISSKHKRGAMQAKFEKTLMNEELMKQLSASSSQQEISGITKIQNDLIILASNGCISQDAAIQYCEVVGISHEELWYSFIELRDEMGLLSEQVPQELRLPAIPFEEYIMAIDSLADGLCEECLEGLCEECLG